MKLSILHSGLYRSLHFLSARLTWFSLVPAAHTPPPPLHILILSWSKISAPGEHLPAYNAQLFAEAPNVCVCVGGWSSMIYSSDCCSVDWGLKWELWRLIKYFWSACFLVTLLKVHWKQYYILGGRRFDMWEGRLCSLYYCSARYWAKLDGR